MYLPRVSLLLPVAVFVLLKSATCSYPPNIINELAFKAIPSTCSICLNQSYSSPTTLIQLQVCSAEYFLVGASTNRSDRLSIAAYGNRYNIMNAFPPNPFNATGPYDGVYWYIGSSFGFAPSPSKPRLPYYHSN